MAFSPIRSLLPNAARRAGITRDLAITKVLRACQGELLRMFGADYAMFADAVSVRSDGAVTIACRSPAVAHTIRMQESTILSAIRTSAETLAVRRLSLVPRGRMTHGDPLHPDIETRTIPMR